MKLLKNIIPCPVCNKRNDYNAYKDIKAHANGWKNKFTCPSCQQHLIHRKSTIYLSVMAVGITGYLHFIDFKYSLAVLIALIMGMISLQYYGVIFKAVKNATRR